MKRKHDCIAEFKNGNINIKIDQSTMEDFNRDSLLTLSSILDSNDCYFFGETFCLSNFETGHAIYNVYSDLVYIFPWRVLEDLKSGKTVKLYARKPDENDREILEREGL